MSACVAQSRIIAADRLRKGIYMEKFENERAHKDLYELFAKITSPEDFEKLLVDLCTFNELDQLSQRLLCAKLLLKGYTYNKIIEITDISSATLSRVSRCLQHGSGGYRQILSAYEEGVQGGGDEA